MNRLAILCPGQGTQHSAMFERVADLPEARPVLGALEGELGVDWRVLLDDDTQLFQNALAQPLVCAAELAVWLAVAGRLPAPAAFLGYSVGELAAYGCAAAFDPATVVKLAVSRASAMDAGAAAPGSLVAVKGLARPVVAALCSDSGAEIAIVNGHDHFVLGGDLETVERAADAATRAGAHTVKRLAVTIASHTSRLSGAVPAFRTALESHAPRSPAIPVVAGVDGSVVRSSSDAVQTLSAQICSTVDWVACVTTARELGCTTFLELGPGAALSRIVLDLCPDAAARSVDDFRTLAGAADWACRQLSRA